MVWNDYKAADSEYIKKFFGEHLSEQIINENAADTATGITREMIEDKRNDIFERSNLVSYSLLSSWIGFYTTKRQQ